MNTSLDNNDRQGARLCGDDGFAAAELPLAITALLMVMLLMVGGLRISNMRGDVEAAARAGARAAASERDFSAAKAAATSVAKATLKQSGLGCGTPSVSAGGDLSGGLVTVTVTCKVTLSDATLAGFPGSHTITVTASERSDQLRAAP